MSTSQTGVRAEKWGAIVAVHPILFGQLLAITASATLLAIQFSYAPVFYHSIYLLYVPVLLICSIWSGASTLTATAILAVGGYVLDGRASSAPHERDAGVVLFVLLGAFTAFVGRRLRVARRDADARLVEQKKIEILLEASIEAVADALIVIDQGGLIYSFNRAAQRLFGWRADDVIGKNVKVLMPDDAAGVHDSKVAHYLATAERTIMGSHRQVTGLRQDGTEFPINLGLSEVRIGTQSFFSGVVRDLTTIREAERRAEQLQAQLSQVWSLNSMGEMASVLAHELNQPLSAVANYLRAARTLIANMELEDDDLIDAVSRAGDQAVRAGEIIRTMRDLATRGGMQQRPESLSGIISEIDFMVGLLARDASVRVSYDLYEGDDTVLADRIQIQQLLVNLVRNAVEAVTKYPNRHVCITTRMDGEHGFVTTVEDSGPGVDANVSDRLFAPLASTKPEGMGLGLSISTAIVENHKGRIWVEPSRLGGAAFCFVLARAGKHGGDANGRADRVRR